METLAIIGRGIAGPTDCETIGMSNSASAITQTARKKEILFLVHRLPFPPNKGDKIRSYHLLEYLAERFDVHLGCFVDDDDDLQYIDAVEEYCKSTCIARLRRSVSALRSLIGFANGGALTNPYYRNQELSKWVDKTLGENEISAVVAFSSPMAQYVLGDSYSRYIRVMDFVDIDSDKWRQYAERFFGLKKWVYRREARLLANYEHMVSNQFDASVFVSENETETFSRSHPVKRNSLHAICNGVAIDYFNPELDFVSPFQPGSKAIVFTGVMDYWPNVDAMCWFTRAVLPQIREARPDAELWIVGASPSKEITQLASLPGVHVTGRVPDVRPYLKHTDVVVAPLRIARGVQNKVLEALAMDKCVVCTPEAAAGLSEPSDAPIRVVESESGFVNEIIEYLGSSAEGSPPSRPRDYVTRFYNWDRNLALFSELLAPQDSGFSPN